MGLLRNLLTSSNAKAHSCTSAGQAQMLIQTAAQGMSVPTASRAARKKWQEAGPEDALEDRLLEGLSVPARFQLSMFPSQSGVCPAGKAETCHIVSNTGEQGKDRAPGTFSTWEPHPECDSRWHLTCLHLREEVSQREQDIRASKQVVSEENLPVSQPEGNQEAREKRKD